MSLFHHDTVLPGEVDLKHAIGELVKRFSKQLNLTATAPQVSVHPLNAIKRANVLITLDGPHAMLQAEALKSILCPGADDPIFGFKVNDQRMPEVVEVNYSLPIDKITEVAGKLKEALAEMADNTFGRRLRAAQATAARTAGKH